MDKDKSHVCIGKGVIEDRIGTKGVIHFIHVIHVIDVIDVDNRRTSKYNPNRRTSALRSRFDIPLWWFSHFVTTNYRRSDMGE